MLRRLALSDRQGERPMQRPALHDMIAQMRHLMASDDHQGDFSYPSALREVPSLTTPDSNYERAVTEYAELGGSTFRDRG